ncbi:uncharacterized protein EDB91DRAFT_1338900 [Suillus paluster]|uniref:uncharacterized protein n=1 Tax=Suillus paluster TaxID=48578 RepID=UPI001B86832B|nr:uncharacterized protein EDB91DRAFT_1338900 [Suillus paluster]KAG1730118.1 hypothetical protein EDB91DRAFT_1338900 [Suillus paluster]
MRAPPSFFGYQIFAALGSLSSACNSEDMMTLLLHYWLVSSGDLFLDLIFSLLVLVVDFYSNYNDDNNWGWLNFSVAFQHDGDPPWTQLHFIGDEDVEYIEGYKLGGYYPVHLGDTFLTQQNPSCWVALKIIIADLTGNRESAVLKWLNTRFRDHPGARQCLLSASVGASVSSVVPGDLHFGNVGFKIPGIDQYTEGQMMELTEEPSILPVIPRDHSAQNDSLPMYLVSMSSIIHLIPRRFAEKLNKQLVVEIMDFVTVMHFGYRMRKPLRHPEMAPVIQPPELTFYSYPTVKSKMSGAMKFVGPLPEQWKPYWNPKPFQDCNGTLNDRSRRKMESTEHDDDELDEGIIEKCRAVNLQFTCFGKQPPRFQLQMLYTHTVNMRAHPGIGQSMRGLRRSHTDWPNP